MFPKSALFPYHVACQVFIPCGMPSFHTMWHAMFSYHVACHVFIPLGMPAVKQKKTNKLLIVLLNPLPEKFQKKIKLN